MKLNYLTIQIPSQIRHQIGDEIDLVLSEQGIPHDALIDKELGVHFFDTPNDFRLLDTNGETYLALGTYRESLDSILVTHIPISSVFIFYDYKLHYNIEQPFLFVKSDIRACFLSFEVFLRFTSKFNDAINDRDSFSGRTITSEQELQYHEVKSQLKQTIDDFKNEIRVIDEKAIDLSVSFWNIVSFDLEFL